ncbi:hypothetical protein [Methanobacterium alcaliphilum]|uniref:hypothetical protein n=1 Tax=Methanobacterium alcaliphilum TaxID=392018 RepID=UPI00200A4C6E|nr:hypothetical protein [Methanobacterium alcaliphilum]MCK9150653.1 hypothetical protein [Methanobacterium alcaliphilum]
MDEKGYAFSPLTFLILIPVLIVAINYGSIVNEANMVATIATGGDVTYSTANNIFNAIEKAAGDAGRNSAYNATRNVIDNQTFLSNSRDHVKQRVLESINQHVIENCKQLENETGRQISINNIAINNYTNATFFSNDVNITQTDPFGFYVTIKGGIPVSVYESKNRQYIQTFTPEISTYVSIEGMEDPYVWLNSKERSSNVFYNYPYASTNSTGIDYQFDEIVDKDLIRLNYLWECMYGTDNPSKIYPRSYYVPNKYGLSFFDRLENKTNSSSTSPANTRMSSFVLGNVLSEDHGRADISFVDYEYFNSVRGYPISIRVQGNIYQPIADPTGTTFYISTASRNNFDLQSQYT